jgi:hypothetical protein
VKENIIGRIFDILHWASWADYIVYIGLTPYVGTHYMVLFLFTLTSLRSHSESATDGKTGEEDDK